MKFVKWYDTLRPSAPGRNAVAEQDAATTPHVVSDNASYVAAQMALVIAALAPFTASPVCPKCASVAISTEHGTRYYVPVHPDKQRTKPEWDGVSFMCHPTGSYHEGPDYLVRSCTVCKHAWAERTADTPNQPPTEP